MNESKLSDEQYPNAIWTDYFTADTINALSRKIFIQNDLISVDRR